MYPSLLQVPHLIAACGVSDGGIDLYIDFRPRADGAYDPSIASLSDYPAPETREAFTEGGNRKDFAAAFFTEEAMAWRQSLLSLDGATSAAPLTKEQTASISAGPMLIDLRLPLSDSAATAAADACTQAVDRWLDWMLNAEEMKRGLSAGMRQTATYTRDTKVPTSQRAPCNARPATHALRRTPCNARLAWPAFQAAPSPSLGLPGELHPARAPPLLIDTLPPHASATGASKSLWLPPRTLHCAFWRGRG